MIKSSSMTVTAVRTTMTSPTVPPQQQHHHQHLQKINRISNFSVASLLADTRPRSPQPTATADLVLVPTNLSSSSSPLLSSAAAITHPAITAAAALHHHHQQQQQHHHSHLLHSSPLDGSSITKNERYTPHSSTESEVDYDSNQEDSIVDIEDIRNENCSTPGDGEPTGKSSSIGGTPQLLSSPGGPLSGHVPIRPTPFSALAAAAAAWGVGGGMPWPGARQMTPFGPPGLFPGQGFGGGHGGPGGKHMLFLLAIARR